MRHVLAASLLGGICLLSQQVSAAQLTAWVVDGAPEKPYFQQLQEAFNAKYGAEGTTVNIQSLPGYNEALQAATVSKGLPDVILVDGPTMASMAWAKTIQPIGPLLDPSIVADLLPAIKDQGTYGPTGDLYQISPYDSSVLLWGNRALLEKAGVRIPTSVKDAWTRDEFRDALAKLKAVPGVEWPLDMKLNYGEGEFTTYAYSPLFQSNGGDLIDRKTWVAEGTINSAANVDVLTELQTWYKNGWIVPASAGDNKFYGEKTAALSWVGNWMWEAHEKGLGKDLVIIPAPKMGPAGVVSPNGGWGWSVPSTSTNLEDIKKFLNFAMSTEQVKLYSDIVGYLPSRTSVTPLSKRYGPGGEGALFADQDACCAIVRPVHPAYPVISAAFAHAVFDAMTSPTADVKADLDAAAKTIDQDIADNQGYPPFNGK